ncbi:MAG: hypothetical protein WCO68_04105 [Verrucomicrobiota bacterium]
MAESSEGGECNNERGIIVSLYDFTTNIVKPWADAGYLCYCVDIQHAPGETRDDNIIKIGTDVCKWWPPCGVKIAMVFSQSPCTHLAVSGRVWFAKKGFPALIDGLTLFARGLEIAQWSGAPYMLENPVSVISTHWRKPDHIFDPCDYGDPYTKKTCLWVGNGFVMPKKNRVAPVEGSKMHKLPPSPHRANIRSVTPMGFARAVFEANHRKT